MEKKMSGTLVSKVLYDELRNFLSTKRKKKCKIIDISIGDDFGGQMYAEMKKKKVEAETGIPFESIHYDNVKLEELYAEIDRINKDKTVYGVMIQLPLPNNLRDHEREILDRISPLKDVDGLTSKSLGNLMVGNSSFVPCTAKGIIVLLKAYGVDLVGKSVSIINRSNIVGKPLSELFLMENATPTVCHSKTEDLSYITKNSDIVVAALNKKEFINSNYISKGTIIVDVGVHRNSAGKTVGDVLFDDVYSKSKLITPPTGGVGPMTICMLCYNVVYSIYGEEVWDVLDKGIEKIKNVEK